MCTSIKVNKLGKQKNKVTQVEEKWNEQSKKEKRGNVYINSQYYQSQLSSKTSHFMYIKSVRMAECKIHVQERMESQRELFFLVSSK